MKGKLLVSFLPLTTIVLWGCASHRMGVPYSKATEKIEALLRARVDKGIFPYSREDTPNETAFRFIEGNRWEKLDHAKALQIEIIVRQMDEGVDSGLEINAVEDRIVIKSPDRLAAKRWREEIRRVTTSSEQ